MSPNLTQLKAFLGKYYQEIAYSTTQAKYASSSIGNVLEQRFAIQNNKAQMIVDPALRGLIMNVAGNEVHISQELYNHPSVTVSNSMENTENVHHNPKSLYNPELFSTLAYLVCQNHTTLDIVSEMEEPIYINYSADFETFYNSVIVVNIAEGLDVEVVEEFNSSCALNAVTNYIVHPNARLNLATFYDNKMSALSFCLRNVIVMDNATYNHMLFGKGSSSVVDETKIQPNHTSKIELLGCINPHMREFHTIVGVHPMAQDYTFFLEHKHVVFGTGKTTFTPIVVGHLPADAYSDVKSLSLDMMADEDRTEKTEEFLNPILERATLERIAGVSRYYRNKTKFMRI
jgi:hypothetical protein